MIGSIGKPKLLTLLLIGSVMLNVFFVGALATRYVLTGRLLPAGHLAEIYINRYPMPIRDKLKVELKARQETLKEIVDELRRARADLHASIRAEPFEKSDVQIAMKRVRSETEALITLLQEALLASVEEAPYEIRQRIPDPEFKLPTLR